MVDNHMAFVFSELILDRVGIYIEFQNVFVEIIVRSVHAPTRDLQKFTILAEASATPPLDKSPIQ